MTQRKRKGTQTSSFGSAGRSSHDSSRFYNSRLYADHNIPSEVSEPDVLLPPEVSNRIFSHSSENMDELPDNCVHLMVTSPPYNVQKEYDDDLTLKEYEALLRTVFTETHRVLTNGGRACINIANLGRKPYLPINALITDVMLEIGFFMRGEIIWDKGSSAGSSTAWGSWMSAANPVLRDVHEYILVFSKGSFSRSGQDQVSTIERDDFLEWTKSIWTFPTVSAKKIGHPAPFPLELPLRLISLYSFQGDIILDPFCGSGTTCQAAKQLNRRYLGYEVNAEYVKLAEERLAQIPDSTDRDDPNI